MIPILITLGIGAAAALVARIATRPAILRVRRSTTVNAPPEAIYPLIEDFRRWAAWSPFEKLDPALRRSFSGAERGKGAVYAWEGNKKAGQGRMEITDTSPPNTVAIKLDFLKPFESHNITEFTMEPRGEATEVTWDMHGPNSTSAKVMQSFISMDKLIGKDFEAGLANIKRVAETGS
jgi:uncharacterized protein YndB with AHSA1/START domain